MAKLLAIIKRRNIYKQLKKKKHGKRQTFFCMNMCNVYFFDYNQELYMSTHAAYSRKHVEFIELGTEARWKRNQSCSLDRHVVALRGLQQALPFGL